MNFQEIGPPSGKLVYPDLITHVNIFLIINNRTGTTKGWTGLIRVDGETYQFMGNAHVDGRPFGTFARQTSHVVTPTQTIFDLQSGPLNITVTFFSPVEYNNTQLQSIPLSYVFVTVASNDGVSHEVQLYMDITGKRANDKRKWAGLKLNNLIR